MSRSLGLTLSVSLAALASVVTPNLAAAGTACAVDGDCLKGELCTTITTPVCDIACLPNTECPPCATPSTTTECSPGASCTTDADCNADLKCVVELTNCATPACPPDTKCDQPVNCVGGTTSSCQPRTTQGCTADSDCGANYTCQFYEVCSGGGSTGGGSVGGSTGSSGATKAGAVDAGSAPIAIAYDGGSAPPNAGGNTCSMGTTGMCAAKTITCVAASDCPSSWTCEQLAGVACAVPAGSTEVCDPGPQPPKECVAPYGSYGGGGLALGASEGSGGSSGAATDPRSASGSQDTGAGSVSHSCQMTAVRADGSGWLAALAGLAVVLGSRRNRRR